MERSGNLYSIFILQISKSCFKKYFDVHEIFKFYYFGKNLFLNIETAKRKKFFSIATLKI